MNKKNMKAKVFFLSVLSLLPLGAFAGQVDLGAQFKGWDSSVQAPFEGSEFWVPFSLSLDLSKGVKVYGSGKFGVGTYIQSPYGSSATITPDGRFSDTALGASFHFKNFSLPAYGNISFNLPTGDTTWEYEQILSNIPTEFIDSRMHAREFGMSFLYGLAFPSGSSEVGAAAGYSFGGSFNPYADTYGGTYQLRLGDSFYLALNRFQKHSGGGSDTLRVTSIFSTPVQMDGAVTFQMGPNFNLAYEWNNPKAFSFEVGAQFYLPSQRSNGVSLVTETYNSYGPRFYFMPSYTIGDFNLAGRLKIVAQNDYPNIYDMEYNGGGLLLGVQPSYLLRLDKDYSLKVYAAYDNIAQNNGVDQYGTRVDVNYNVFTFGTNAELRF